MPRLVRPPDPSQDQPQIDPCGRQPPGRAVGVAVGHDAGHLLPGRVAEPRQGRRGVPVELAAVEHEVVVARAVTGLLVHPGRRPVKPAADGRAVAE
ncbi:MAG: hypothetical protein ACRDRK_12650, partial [Pseudonocardia sp.]